MYICTYTNAVQHIVTLCRERKKEFDDVGSTWRDKAEGGVRNCASGTPLAPAKAIVTKMISAWDCCVLDKGTSDSVKLSTYDPGVGLVQCGVGRTTQCTTCGARYSVPLPIKQVNLKVCAGVSQE